MNSTALSINCRDVVLFSEALNAWNYMYSEGSILDREQCPLLRGLIYSTSVAFLEGLLTEVLVNYVKFCSSNIVASAIMVIMHSLHDKP